MPKPFIFMYIFNLIKTYLVHIDIVGFKIYSVNFKNPCGQTFCMQRMFRHWQVLSLVCCVRLMNQRSQVRCPVQPHTFVSPSADSRRAFVSYWQKYVHKVLLNCLGGLSLTRKSVVRLTDRPDLTIDVYCECKTATAQQQLKSCCVL